MTQEHDSAVLQLIRADIDDYDAFKNWNAADADEQDEDNSGDAEQDNGTQSQVYHSLPQRMGQRLKFGDHIFGAPEKAMSIGQLEGIDPVAKVIPEGLTELLKAMSIKNVQGEDINVQSTDNVTCYFIVGV